MADVNAIPSAKGAARAPDPPDEGQAPSAPEVPPKAAAATAPDEGAHGESSDEHDDDLATGLVNQEAQTIFNVGWISGDASLGGDGGPTQRIRSGRLEADQVAAELRCYVPPQPFERAAEILRDNHLVVLQGRAGIGKRTGALMLLNPEEHDITAIIAYPPSTRVGDLADRKLAPGQRSLIEDFLGSEKASAENRFDLERLKARLVRDNLYLVITAEPRRAAESDFDGLIVQWALPDLGKVFDRLVGLSDPHMTDDEGERARAHAAVMSRPREVVDFVARLADGVDNAINTEADRHRSEVVRWFDEPGRPVEDILTVAAACFASDQSDRYFDRALAALIRTVKSYDHDERQPTSAQFTLDPVWHGSSEHSGLIVKRADPTTGEPKVQFRSHTMRVQAIAELWERYGYSLHEPLRVWIMERATKESLPARIQLAAGVAILASLRHRWPEVRASYLEIWSAGDWLQRLTAVYTISLMCDNDELAPAALETVLEWAENGRPLQAGTAALALGGPLGGIYRTKSFETLWHLTTKRHTARTAQLALSFAVSGAKEALDRCLELLRTTMSALKWTKEKHGGARLRVATSTALRILQAPVWQSDDLAIADVLLTEPQSADPIGVLLAAVLESGPHRQAGIDVVRSIFSSLKTTDQMRSCAMKLGEVVSTAWPTATLRILKPQIERDLSRSPAETESARQLLHDFLHGIRVN